MRFSGTGVGHVALHITPTPSSLEFIPDNEVVNEGGSESNASGSADEEEDGASDDEDGDLSDGDVGYDAP